MANRRTIYLAAFGEPGHAFPMLALGAELARRGHRVTYETWQHWRADVEAAGLRFVAAPEHPIFPTLEKPLAPYEVAFRGVGETRQRIRESGAEIVVHDILTLAPALAGELEERAVATLIPHLYPVTAPGSPPYAVGARLPRTVIGRRFWDWASRRMVGGLALGRDELNATRRRLGLVELDRFHGGLSDTLCLVATFPQLEYPRTWPARTHVVGPLFWEPPAPARAPLGGEGPLVLVAPSTAQDPRQRMLAAALGGLGGLTLPDGRGGVRAPLRVLATTNRRPLSEAVRMRPHTELVNWLSYSRTMPAADLVVLHAGHGTMVRALATGTPVLAIPHVGDMAENAARVDWAGAGVRLPWHLLSEATLRWAVQRALDPASGIAERATAFRCWAEAHDGAARAADLVEALG